jgi:hypothetical protein
LICACAGAAAAARASGQPQTLSVERFGASGKGVSDDSAAVQAAIDQAAASGGAAVHIPPGVYLVHGLRLRSNVRLLGAGRDRTVLRETSGIAYLLSVNPGKEGSADPSRNEHDIEIAHIAFEGPVSVLGFAEHQHLLNLNGVTRLQVHDCAIRGFRGDGIYLGSGNVAGIERHNVDIRIARNEFDGVTGDNRNAIGVIDGEGVVISNNRFVRCSRATMPGPIDVEPNGYPFQRIRGIAIEENRFDDCGGSIAKISVHIPVPDALLRPTGDLRIARNIVGPLQKSGNALYVRVLDASGKPRRVSASGIEVLDNVLSHGKATLQGIENFVIKGNQFAARHGGVVVGALHAGQVDGADHGIIAANTFHPPANGQAALVIGRARRVMISGNRFPAPEHPGVLGPAIALAAERGKPLYEALSLEANLFADQYSAHVAAQAPATAAQVRVGQDNATFAGKPLRSFGLGP